MAKGYSLDLRERVVNHILGGGKKKEASRVFQVGEETVYRWMREYKKEGGVKPRTRKPYKTRKIDKEKLLFYLKRFPDAILEEIAQEFKVSIGSVSKACKRFKITRKKKSFV